MYVFVWSYPYDYTGLCTTQKCLFLSYLHFVYLSIDQSTQMLKCMWKPLSWPTMLLLDKAKTLIYFLIYS